MSYCYCSTSASIASLDSTQSDVHSILTEWRHRLREAHPQSRSLCSPFGVWGPHQGKFTELPLRSEVRESQFPKSANQDRGPRAAWRSRPPTPSLGSEQWAPTTPPVSPRTPHRTQQPRRTATCLLSNLLVLREAGDHLHIFVSQLPHSNFAVLLGHVVG